MTWDATHYAAGESLLSPFSLTGSFHGEIQNPKFLETLTIGAQIQPASEAFGAQRGGGGKMGHAVAFANQETPPEDDVCPICFGEFVLPCRANCGHWFCGSCILQVWNFSSAFQACKCPMCCSHIKNLKPNSMLDLQDEEDRKVLQSIERYNRLFVGGVWGFILKLYDLPLLLRRVISQMLDPNQIDQSAHLWRFLAILLGTLYLLSPFKFIPQGVNVMALCNFASQVVVLVMRMIGLIQTRRSAERVRLAALQHPAGA